MPHTTNSPHRAALIGAALPLAWGLLGCAATQAPQQLVDARDSYQVGAKGEAARYAPDQLLEADKLLKRAESERTGSDEQIHLAYLADRQARLAEAEGEREMGEARLADAKQQYVGLQDERRSQAEAGLENTKQRLAETQQELASILEKMRSKDANLDDLEKQRGTLEQRQTQLEQQLTVQGAALTQSERARTEAEKRARAAIASLKELAQIKEEQNETIVTLSGAVLFKTGKSELLPLAENTLNQVAIAFKQLDESQTVVIEGYTDSRGAEDMNEKLSQERADSVRNYLIGKGVRGSSLQAVGKGESDPVAPNDTAEGRANNRRVEMVISPSTAQGGYAKSDRATR